MSAGTSWIGALLRQPWSAATAATAMLAALVGGALEPLSDRSYDVLSHWFTHASATESVVVTIDERSLREVGPWPWLPEQLAQLTDRITAAGGRVVAFDLASDTVPDSRANADADALPRAMRRNGGVVLAVTPSEDPEGDLTEVRVPPAEWRRSARGEGHTFSPEDHDGVQRRLPSIVVDGGARWPSLAQAALEVAHPERDPESAPGLPGAAIMGRWLGSRERLLPASPVEIPVVSAADLLHNPKATPALAGKVVWLGLMVRGSVASHTLPGVATHPRVCRTQWQAQAYEHLRTDRVAQAVSPAAVLGFNLVPLALISGLHWLRPRRTHVAQGLVGIALPIVISVALLALWQIWLPTLWLTLGCAAAFGLSRLADLHDAQRQLRRTREEARATLRAITDGVITVDKRLRVRYLNPSAERLLGYRRADVLGRRSTQILAMRTQEIQMVEQAVQQCIQAGEVVELAVPLHLNSTLGLRMVHMIASPITTQDDLSAFRRTLIGRVGAKSGSAASPLSAHGAVLALTDVTEMVRATERLQHQATHDLLTGLPNRALLRERLTSALTQNRRTGAMAAVLFLDLDRFKRINDCLGHHHGDSVLRGVADRLVTHCSSSDTVARWGGDEFVVLLPNAESIERVEQRALDLIQEVTRVFDLDGIEVECGCCIGAALAPRDADDVDTLLSMADRAMYLSKAAGGKHFSFFEAALQPHNRDTLNLEARARKALNDGSFELHYQPQVDLRTRYMVGMEALLRWRQPDGTLWSPGRFLGLTEDSGLIRPLGNWVIHEAVRQIGVWLQAGLSVVPVSINVSARQCLDRSLPRVILQALEQHKVPARHLKVEITESTAMSDLGHLEQLLTELREIGVDVALDDFGTGYSSLSHLKRLPIGQIKIDPSFVRDLNTNANSATIVQATIALAHALGLPVVAEGVESSRQLKFLLQHDCDIIQGFHFAPAMPGADATAFLTHTAGRPLSPHNGVTPRHPLDSTQPALLFE